MSLKDHVTHGCLKGNRGISRANRAIRRETVTSKSVRIEDLTAFATEVIRQSGQEALRYYGKGNPDVKFDDDLVTDAELFLKALFQGRLKAQFPEHLIFQYDQQNKGYSHEGGRYLWIFDPLDGVANFQAGIPIWGTSLALIENFWPIFGLFYMPVTGDLFYARVGHKAFRGEEELHISSQDNINDESLLLTHSRFHRYYHSTFPGKIRDLGCTSAHVCYVAMGRAEAAIIAHESYQDLAAARIIAEAAGATIFKMDGSEFSLDDYLDGTRIDDHLLVAGTDTRSQILGYLQEIT
jgi:myo-inositol-1(or 4)-monophosphatase